MGIRKKKIAVIIVEYNTPERCVAYIEQFKKACDVKSVGFIIIDNYIKADNSGYFDINSDDIVYIKSKENSGFAKANNIGADIANKIFDPEYYLFSNTDIILPEKLNVSTLISKIEDNKEYAVAGPEVKGLDGTNLSPSKKVSIVKKHIISNLIWPVNLFIPKMRESYKSIISNPIEGRCYYVVGAFMLTKKDAFINVNGFDEGTFLYGEEPIYAERLLRKGYKEYYCPLVSIVHEEGGTTYDYSKDEIKNLMVKRKRVFESEMYYYKKYIGTKNITIYFAKAAFTFFCLKLKFYGLILNIVKSHK